MRRSGHSMTRGGRRKTLARAGENPAPDRPFGRTKERTIVSFYPLIFFVYSITCI